MVGLRATRRPDAGPARLPRLLPRSAPPGPLGPSHAEKDCDADRVQTKARRELQELQLPLQSPIYSTASATTWRADPLRGLRQVQARSQPPSRAPCAPRATGCAVP